LYECPIKENNKNIENITESNIEGIEPNVTKSEFVTALSEWKEFSFRIR